MNVTKTIILSFYMSLLSTTTIMAADQTDDAMTDPAIVSFHMSSSPNEFNHSSESHDVTPGCACTDKQTVRGLQKELFDSKAGILETKRRYEKQLESQRELISQLMYVIFQSQKLIAQQGETIESLQKQDSELTAELANVKKNSQEVNRTLCRVVNQKNGDLRQIGELLKEASNIDSDLLAQIMSIIRSKHQE